MSIVFRRLAGDFFSTILFVAVWTASGSVLVASAIAMQASAVLSWADGAPAMPGAHSRCNCDHVAPQANVQAAQAACHSGNWRREAIPSDRL